MAESRRSEFRVSTRSRTEMVDITGQVEAAVREAGIRNGDVIVFCPHTTAAITINENADPSVVHDILLALDEIMPRSHPGYRHDEGNSDAHGKSSLVGCSEQVLVKDGGLGPGHLAGDLLLRVRRPAQPPGHRPGPRRVSGTNRPLSGTYLEHGQQGPHQDCANVVLLSIVRFLTDLSSEMMPILPMFLESLAALLFGLLVMCGLVIHRKPVKTGNEGNKNGEVVGPAGGETGGPRCLAEVHLLSLPEAILMSRESKSYCNCLNLPALSTNTDTARVSGCSSHPMPLH